MTRPLPSPLPSRDCALLRVALRIVPEDERQDWLRCWQAELWHRHYPRAGAAQPANDLYSGLLRDALWLRQECLRRAFAGTAFLCLVMLALLVCLTSVPLFMYFEDLHQLLLFVIQNAPRFVVESFLTAIVGFAFASQTIAGAGRHTPLVRLQSYLFGAAKLLLLLLAAYLLSLDLTQPFLLEHPFATEMLQPQIFSLIALIGLRWGLQDQGTRCRHCLRTLSEPLRVGPPSWNFLESNGTEQNCPDGHGLLSVPEIETSWRRSSEWIVQ